MQALKLSKKYPEFKQDEIFDLVNKFRYVRVPLSLGAFYLLPLPCFSALRHYLLALYDLWSFDLERSFRTFVLGSADDRQIDVEEKGSLDKAAVIAALGQSGDADYDSVSPLHLGLPYLRGNYQGIEGMYGAKASRCRWRRMGPAQR